jgi:hypothetical protein
MLKHLGRFVGAGLLAAALFAAPQARATDLSLDGNLRLQCDVATASAGAATLNNKCGTITSEALTTAVGSAYTLTLTNSVIAAADIVLVEVGNGTNTGGGPTLQKVTPASGSAVISVINNNTGTGAANSVQALNGTITVKYLVVKP